MLLKAFLKAGSVVRAMLFLVMLLASAATASQLDALLARYANVSLAVAAEIEARFNDAE